jgi:thioredoxin-like negative regulator of GroEL
MGMQLQRIANEIADVEEKGHDNTQHNKVIQTGTVRFASVEYSANIELSKALGITKLPTVLIYSNKKLVDGFPCGPKRLAFLLQKIDQYQALSLGQLAFEASMREGTELGNVMLEQVLQNPQHQQQPQSQTRHQKPESNVLATQPTKKWRRFWPF